MHTMLWVLFIYIVFVLVLLLIFFIIVRTQKDDRGKPRSDDQLTEKEHIATVTDVVEPVAHMGRGAEDYITTEITDDAEDAIDTEIADNTEESY